MDETSFEKKPGKKKGLIIGIVVIIIAAIIGGCIFLIPRSKPNKIFERAIDEAFGMAEKDNNSGERLELELSAKIESQEAEAKMINSVLSDIKLNTTTEIDINKKILNQNFRLTYDNEQLIDATGLIQNDTMYFYLKDLYSKYIKVDKEFLEEEDIDIASIFEISEKSLYSENLTNDIKQICIDAIKDKEFTQEKVELNGKNVQKTSLKLNAKETAQIIKKIVERIDKVQQIEDVEDLLEELDEVDTGSFHIDIAVYTTGLDSKIVKTELAIVSDEEDFAFAIESEKKSNKETVITVSINENSAKVNKAQKILEITVNEENKNSGNIKIKIYAEEEMTVILSIKYKIDYKAKIEERDVSNNKSIEDMTESDEEEILENIEKNKTLYSFLEMIGGSTMFNKVTPSVNYYDDVYDYNSDWMNSYYNNTIDYDIDYEGNYYNDIVDMYGISSNETYQDLYNSVDSFISSY